MDELKDIKKMELLAPAGSYESVRAAVNAGADAVYMGGPLFSARAYAESSGEDMLHDAIDLCHLHGVRIYMTLNTLMKDEEMERVRDYLLPYYEHGIDGVIIQDLGLLMYIREHFPGLPLHASTQMTVTGPYFARMLRDHGVERVVPARELSLSEIREIADIDGLSVEVFAHGALCYCYSGQCLMSSCIGGRSGNRGRCAGPCRLPYDGEYILSLKDLNTLASLPELYLSGVSSLKIEGRMKSPLYVAGVTGVYRKYLDRLYAVIRENGGENCLYDKEIRRELYPDREDLRILSEIFDRGGSTDGYLKKQNGRDMLQLSEKPSIRVRDEEVIRALTERYLKEDRKVEISGRASFISGRRPKLSVWTEDPLRPGNFFKAEAAGEQTIQNSKNAPLSEKELRDRLSRTGGTGFLMKDLDIRMDEGIFVSVGQINALRRMALDELRTRIISGSRRDGRAV